MSNLGKVYSMKIDALQHPVVMKFSIVTNRSYPKKFGNYYTIADSLFNPVVLNELASDIGIKVVD